MTVTERPASEDYVSEVVPSQARRNGINVFVVWIGFIIVVGIMAVGGGLAAQMDLRSLLTAILLGNLVLATFAAFSGYIGARSGQTFNQLMSDVFPGWSWRLVSLYAPLVLVGWFGVEAAIFGNLIGEIFDLSVPARRVSMASVTLMFAVTSYLGFNAIRMASTFLVPLIVAIGLFGIYKAAQTGSAQFGFGNTTLSVAEGMQIVHGTWIMGVLTCLPDLTRFCRSRLSGALIGAIGIFLANGFSLLVGAFAAGLAGDHDPARILVSFGFIPLAVILALANIWTTNDNNMYSAALNVARLGGVSRRQAVVMCAIVASAFAACDPTSIGVLFGFLGFMGNTAPALGGVVLGAYVWNCRTSPETRSAGAAWLGWILGSATSVLVGGALAVPAGFFIGFATWLCATRIRNMATAAQS